MERNYSMTINIQLIQTLLTVILSPALFSVVGDMVASVLAQDGFPQIANDLIAWLVLLLAAIGSMFAANEFTPSLPGVAYALVIAVFLLVNGSMGKLRPWLIGLDWIQSNVFDVAWGKGGQPTTAGLAKINVEGLAVSAAQSLLPEIERLFQQYNKPVQQQPLARVIPQRPVAPFLQNDGTLQPVQAPNPQAMPAVDVATMNTRTTSIVSSATAMPDLSTVRNWNDSGLIPTVGQGQPGQ
jgi:hypothetical protein